MAYDGFYSGLSTRGSTNALLNQTLLAKDQAVAASEKSELNVDTSLTNAESAQASADSAAISASEASLSAAEAKESEDYAKLHFGRYVGAFAFPPQERADGSPLQVGDEYDNTVDFLRYKWTSVSWLALNSSAQELEARLANSSDPSKGASAIGYLPKWEGAVGRDLSSRQEETIWVTDFGAAGNGANDTLAFQKALDAAYAENKGIVMIPAGRWRIPDGLNRPAGVTMQGQGAFDRKIGFSGGPIDERGTILDLTGGAGLLKSLPFEQLFSLVDPDTGVTYGAEDLTSFRCGIWSDSEGGAAGGMRDLVVLTDDTPDNAIDVGICDLDGQRFLYENVNTFGPFRKHGMLVAATDQTATDYSESSQESLIFNCKFQGKKGLGIRAGDSLPISGVTSSTLTLPKHSWLTALKRIVVSFGGATATGYQYTGCTDNRNGSVTLTGVTPDPITRGVTTSSVAILGTTFGTQGLTVAHSYLSGLDDTSKQVCTSLGFSTAGGCLELIGPPSTGVRFIDCVLMTHEDAIITTIGASGTRFIACNAEVKAEAGGAVGSRWIAPYSVAGFRSVNSDMNILGCAFMRFVDMTPTYARGASQTKFTSDGFFDPKTHKNDEYQPFIDRSSTRDIVRRLPGRAWTLEKSDGIQQLQVSDTELVLNGLIIRTEIGTNLALRTRGTLTQFRDTSSANRFELDMLNSVAKFDMSVRPTTDNARELGDASFRWSVVRAATGTIVTSDIHAKTDIRSVEDKVMDAWSCVEYAQYKFIDSVEQKGDGARWHFGVIAQRVKAAFEVEGLDAFSFGLLCHDVWEELPEITDEDGEVIQHYRPSGERYGIRYEEALCLEVALTRRTLARQEADTSTRLLEMEARLSALEAK